MKLSPLLLVASLLVVSNLAAAPAMRVWTDSEGRKVEASFLKLESGTVFIQTVAGSIFSLPLERLSAEDQQIAKTLPPSDVMPLSLTPLAADASVADAAVRIDQLVESGMQRANLKRAEAAAKSGAKTPPAQLKANPAVSDEIFLRRIYLDVVGRIPNYEETIAFLRSAEAGKRTKLIERLLASEGYVSHNYNYFAEALRIKDDLGRGIVRGTPYIQWIKQCLRENKPWDQMAYAMVTAEGKMWSNGAAGYLLRDAGMPLDNLSYTLQVFIGTDVACAQCHDHPFLDWTQRQFYEMAAFFGSTVTEMGGRGPKKGDRGESLLNECMAIMKGKGVDGEQYRGMIGNVIGANKFAVSDTGENRMKLPADYRYKDASPNEPVQPKLIMWSEDDAKNPSYQLAAAAKSKGVKPREVFGRWLTHPSNPRFAMTIANRLWARVFGMALTPSVRNVDNPDEAFNPELLRHIASEMVRLRFDMKAFQRILFNTKTYQRDATTDELALGEPYYFQGPLLRRMTAEQAWDSYMTLLLGDPDALKTPPEADLYGRSLDVNLTTVDAQTLLQKVSIFNTIDDRRKARMGAKLEDAGGKSMSDKIVVFGNMKLMRASELEQPAPGGHFLRDFGQSERLTIDGSTKDGSSPQVLMMMNGLAQKMLTNPDSLIARNMEKVKGPPEKVEVVFLSILNHHPTFREKDIVKRIFAEQGEGAYGSIIWSLLNTREFFFIQ